MSVTGVPISSLPAATEPLVGDELVPVVQGGVTRQTTVSAMAPNPDVPEATLRGRAVGGGAGPVTSLTAGQAALVIAAGRATGNIGYLNVPPVAVSSNLVLAVEHDGVALLLEDANSYTVTINGALHNGFAVTLVVLDPAGSFTIEDADGDVILNLADGKTGDFTLAQGIATLWKANDGTWTIHGTNVTLIEPLSIDVTIGDDGGGIYGFEWSGGSYEYGDSDPTAPIADAVSGDNILGVEWSEFGMSINVETDAAALKAAYTAVEIEEVGGGTFITVNMSSTSAFGTSLFLGNTVPIQALAWDTLGGQVRTVRFVP